MSNESTSQAISNGFHRIRTIAYWTFTLPVAFENAAGAMWVFSFRLNYLAVTLGHLGYPQYFKYILGAWQLACAATLLAPRLPRVKEWAYAGAFFNYSSAIVSHLFAGDPLDVGAAVMIVFTVVSWALRPPDRRLGGSMPVGKTSAIP
ncbi:MAG TPA: DoxX family protein [Candidatus Binatia bacterium]|nr:DoxX family protein [Candidatus Binatia bacterium]